MIKREKLKNNGIRQPFVLIKTKSLIKLRNSKDYKKKKKGKNEKIHNPNIGYNCSNSENK